MGVRRREAQGTPGLLSEDISAPASAREISGIDDGHAREMVRGGGDLAWDALHEDVVGPARGSVEELDHVVGRTDRPGQAVRRTPGEWYGTEPSWGSAARPSSLARSRARARPVRRGSARTGRRGNRGRSGARGFRPRRSGPRMRA